MKKYLLDYDRYHNQQLSHKDSYLNVDENWPEIKKIISSFDRNLRILEIGSGGGYFCDWLYNQGFKNVTASDYSKTALETINERFPNIKTELIDANNFNLKNYDVIISLDVIEHLRDIKSHLDSVHEALNNRGMYIIKTPNKYIENIYYKKILLRKDIQKKHPWWTAHISLQSKNDLKNYLINANFININFIKQTTLTKAQIKKAYLVLPSFIAYILIYILDLMLFIIPIQFGVQLIVCATKHET